MNIHVNKPGPSGRITTIIEIGHADLHQAGRLRPFDEAIRAMARGLHSASTQGQLTMGATTNGILPRPLTEDVLESVGVELLVSQAQTGVTGFLTLRGDKETVVLVATVVFNAQ